MKYLLDTNVCIRYINGRSPRLREIFDSKEISDLAVSAITKAEMYYGSRKSQTPERSRAKQDDFLQNIVSLPFDDYAAEEYGKIRAGLVKQGTPISPQDMLIAATAVAKRLTVVTHNTRHFSRIPGLRIEDWEAV